MSERDDRYAEWWEPVFVFLVLLIAAAGMDACHGSQLHDLQRRVGQLEEKVK